MKRYDILTLFPGIFEGPLRESILRRAQEKGIVRIVVHDLRAYTHDRHRVVDDLPYGGGAGMVLKPEPVVEAVEDLTRGEAAHLIFLTPQGRTLTQEVVEGLVAHDHLLFLCGRYEGIDERIRLTLHPDEISIGDYVLTGGEIPALVVIDAVVRLLPGVLGDADSARQESFTTGILDHPHYTRPAVFRGMPVPAVLLSGDHEAIRRWRRKEALRHTRRRRPDLLSRVPLSPEDEKALREIEEEERGRG